MKKPAVQETPGEDPHTNGAYATALAHGMQGTDPDWLQVSGCAKHFAVHSWNTPSTYMAFPTKQVSTLTRTSHCALLWTVRVKVLMARWPSRS